MRGTNAATDDRAQAFTLEGFISAIVILTAVLFALQAVVITPTTGGAVDRAAQAQEQQEVQDALTVAAESGNLSGLVRNWDTSASDPGWVGNVDRPDAAYNNSEFAEISDFGRILDEQFVNSSAKAYNLEFIAYDSGTRHTESIVRMGGGKGDGAVSASYFVTVYDEQPLTEPDGSGGFDEQPNTNLEDARDDYDADPDRKYPFPDLDDSTTDFQVIEVRVTVW